MSVDFDSLELKLMQGFLEGATSTEWLVTALTMNYDGASELIGWMSSHPKLDRATAAALYWYSQPGYFQRFGSEGEVPSVNRGGWNIVHALQARIAAGDVGEAHAAFDPANDLSSPTGDPSHPGADWTAEALTAEDAPAWSIPEAMFEPVEGEAIDVRGYVGEHGWEEGMPPSVLIVLEAAYDEEEGDEEESDE